MNEVIMQRLQALRKIMKERGIDAYLVPTDDFHSSEYVGEYFKCRKYITGFTGSAGTAVILADEAGLWTDGRYFTQAEAQLAGTGVDLYRMREESVPTIEEYLLGKLGEGQVLGCDGRTITASLGAALGEKLGKIGVRIDPQMDLIGEIWTDRPALSCEQVWILNKTYTGELASSKLERVRTAIREKGADSFILTSLDDIAWLLNLRGSDVDCNPVFMSYLYMDQEETVLYGQRDAFNRRVLEFLEENEIELRPYEAIYRDAKEIPETERVLLDPSRVNFALRALIKAQVQESENPTLLMKAIKNQTEVDNMKLAHVKDGVAMTRFIYWLKQNAGTGITELSAAEKLEEFREEQENYIGPSFTPIIGYGAHAAIIHYSATEETCVPIEAKGMVLTDTGGQYLEGTTDITRTTVLGEVTDREKEFFTRVLRGHLNLGAVHFLHGCGGQSFDYIAKEPLWEIGEDYNHGTGHGVGFVLNVHEGPNSIRYMKRPGEKDFVFEEGMITSDEPGYYLPGEFGIRHENLIVCKKAEKRSCGQFMEFEYLTLVPFDLDGIKPELMQEIEKKRLNEYHAKVYETISPFLPEEEKAWLKNATRPI